MEPCRNFTPCREDESVEPKRALPASLCRIATRSRCRVSSICHRVERSHTLPTDQQGLKVLGVPVGHPHFVLKFLEQKIDEQRVLLDRIPQIPDTQSAWLLLSFCAAARANFFLRAVSPDLTDQFAASHDDGVWQCLCRILKILPTCGAWEQSSLPLWKGGLGLRSAHRTQPAAHWASWADALKMVHERHPGVAETMVGALETNGESSSIQAVLRCARSCRVREANLGRSA